MTPTTELVNQWASRAGEIAMNECRRGDDVIRYIPEYSKAFATLAATWGAEQMKYKAIAVIEQNRSSEPTGLLEKQYDKALTHCVNDICALVVE